MDGVIATQLIFILLGLYFIVRALRKMPKSISYTIYGLMIASTVTILIMGFYYPETLESWNGTLTGWQNKLQGG